MKHALEIADYAATGKHLGPLPPPGVYARHNAVDTPALLPDGTPSELSVSRVLTARGQNLSATDRAAEITSIDAELRSPLGDDGGPVTVHRGTASAASIAATRGQRMLISGVRIHRGVEGSDGGEDAGYDSGQDDAEGEGGAI